MPMGIIAAKIINKPRKIRRCDSIPCQKWMQPGWPQVRLFGYAFKGDPVDTVYICLDCAEASKDKKIVECLTERG